LLSAISHWPCAESQPTIFQRFFGTETAAGSVLLLLGIAALVLANSPQAEAYDRVWQIRLTFGITEHSLSLTLHRWISDGLMGVFAASDGCHCWVTPCLAGIGFTMSLFIAMLAFDETGRVHAAKSGILAGSLLAGIAGTIVLRIASRFRDDE